MKKAYIYNKDSNRSVKWKKRKNENCKNLWWIWNWSVWVARCDIELRQFHLISSGDNICHLSLNFVNLCHTIMIQLLRLSECRLSHQACPSKLWPSTTNQSKGQMGRSKKFTMSTASIKTASEDIIHYSQTIISFLKNLNFGMKYKQVQRAFNFFLSNHVKLIYSLAYAYISIQWALVKSAIWQNIL